MKILLAIDGSRYSLAATRFLCAYMADPARQVDVVHVLPVAVSAGAAFPRRQSQEVRLPQAARSWFDRTINRLEARGFKVAKHVRRGLPVHVIPALAVKGRYDLVVAGAKGRSDTPYLPIGSVALAVLEQDAFAHVLLVRERELKRKKQIPTRVRPFTAIFAVDGSQRAEQAARVFYEMFSAPHLQPIALSVADAPEPAALAGMDSADRRRLLRELDQAAWRWARTAKSWLARPGVRPQARMVRGRPAAAIVEEARRNGASLIVLGSRGVKSPTGWPLGSVALQVARHAPCSVLIVRYPR
ncbi:MAG: universal stress protein [Steroidobacteraceae bacterium]|jgi:nucleotide-binding universal stress UspA family protein|nr:universal stress protein [Steroidobacteraceae bacterium]